MDTRATNYLTLHFCAFFRTNFFIPWRSKKNVPFFREKQNLTNNTCFRLRPLKTLYDAYLRRYGHFFEVWTRIQGFGNHIWFGKNHIIDQQKWTKTLQIWWFRKFQQHHFAQTDENDDAWVQCVLSKDRILMIQISWWCSGCLQKPCIWPWILADVIQNHMMSQP